MALFSFNRQAMAAKVLKSVDPHPRFSERELEQCLLNFSANMRFMATGVKYITGSMAIVGALVFGKMAADHKPVPAAIGAVVAVSSALFARRQAREAAFFGEVLQVTSDRQLGGARKFLREQSGVNPA